MAEVTTVREIDKIKADLTLVTNRLKLNRQRLDGQRDGSHYLSGADFAKLCDQITADERQKDAFLAELFSAMAWQNPELLGE